MGGMVQTSVRANFSKNNFEKGTKYSIQMVATNFLGETLINPVSDKLST